MSQELTIPARDGFELAATLYLAKTHTPDAIVLINSATGVKRSFYDKYARFLAEQGFTVLTYDYRGIGGSRPVTLNKFQAFMHDWGEKDMAGVLDWLAVRYPNLPIAVVGHSVGGQIFGLADNNHRVAALLLVASQSGYWKLWPWSQRGAIFLFWHLVLPVSTAVLSYFPAKALGMGQNLPAGVAFEWASWGRDPNYLLGQNRLTSKENFKNYRGPLLSYSVANDFFAPAKAVDMLTSFYANASAERRHLTAKTLSVPRFGHFDFFKEDFKDSLWRESLEWLRDKLFAG